MNFDYKRMLKFENNIGTKEKTIRLYSGAGLIIISLPFAKIILLVLGLYFIATGYSGWCPVYSGMAKNTCETK